MTIKDVEKLTGLTAKSIRYYEGKGLITVERNEENDYRSYTEVEVNRLKRIKLLRYLDFSVEEVKSMLDMDIDEIEKVLHQKAEKFLDQSDKCKDKQKLCLTLAKDYKKNEESHDKVIDEYNEMIEFMESDEITELEEGLKDFASPSLMGTIGVTLICLGPIMWLFINIQEGMLDQLMWNAVLALIGTAWLAWNWIHYISERRKNKNRIRNKNRESIGVIPITIITIVLGCVVVVVLDQLTGMMLAPDNYLFYEYHPVVEGKVMVWVIMAPLIFIAMLIVEKITSKTKEDTDDVGGATFLWNKFGKYRPVVILVWCIGLYCCITSVTFVTEEKIIYHSPIHPTGVEYSYDEIEKITTGFGDSSFALMEYKKKGSFYYQLKIDGKTIIFHQPTPNGAIEKYKEDTYLELEEFDQRLVGLEISKEGDSRGYENCHLDQRYVDRFVRITELK